MADPRPNILWFTTDQQRFDTIGALGNPHVRTTVMDELVAGGTTFTHAFCQSPICTPSRSSFLTGMYPSSIRQNRNGNEVFNSDAPLVTKLIVDAGYVCGNVGKLHLASGHGGIESRVDDGYTVFDYSHAPRDNAGYDYADWVRAQGTPLDDLHASPEGVPAELHQTTWCADRAIDFIENHQSDPWLLTVNPYYPHPPFDPPISYRDRYDPDLLPGPHFRQSDLVQQAALAAVDFQTTARSPEGGGGVDESESLSPYRLTSAVGLHEDMRHIQAAYYAMIELIDDQLGRILKALDATAQRENTLVLFTSDHGEALGDHGLVLKGARFYEGLVRVPLIFNAPGRVTSGKRSSALVELTDLAPTLLDFLGLSIPEAMQGESLAPILMGAGDATHHRDYVRCEYFDAVDLPDATSATMFRTERYKLVRYHNHGLGELYDLSVDPWEHDNLWDAPEHRETKLDLLQRSFDASIMAMDTGPRRVAPW
ncbi:MAG: sulfatase family protein [Alphaproteobacteria bacterium]